VLPDLHEYVYNCTKLHDSLHVSRRSHWMSKTGPKMILIAGPYQSGTGGEPKKIADNLAKLESYTLPIYQAGHLPVIGEWLALPIIAQAAQRLGKEKNQTYEAKEQLSRKFLYPVANRLVTKCDAVLRITGESKGADEDVRLAQEMGKPVFYSLSNLLEYQFA
jgi:hypothetical protein